LTLRPSCSRFVYTNCRIQEQDRSNSKYPVNIRGGIIRVSEFLPEKIADNLTQAVNSDSGAAFNAGL
jgi:hypothetical protein